MPRLGPLLDGLAGRAGRGPLEVGGLGGSREVRRPGVAGGARYLGDLLCFGGALELGRPEYAGWAVVGRWDRTAGIPGAVGGRR
ncbi:MAG: hypothetical protein AUG44_27960 [Actinobacteria bacterium 13_1_20CM_3_71_11]|nr:MAG: hypothetical protein AUG44_27960 [Actinobacteria bacterium 13_1_20CM_3_71_11]